MYISKLPYKTIKTVESDTLTDSQKLLIRSGIVRKYDRNQFALLPLGQLIIDNINNYIEEILKDENYVKLNTYSTDEFVNNITKFVASDIKSYKDLPRGYYETREYERKNTQTKNRLLDAKHYNGFKCIKYFRSIEACNEAVINIADNISTILDEFNVNTDIIHSYNSCAPNQDAINIAISEETSSITYKCDSCGYNVSSEIIANISDPKEDVTEEIDAILTENIKTIEELTEFLNVDSTKLAKTLLLKADSELIAVVIRGDRELNLAKLSAFLNINKDRITMADNDDIEFNLDTVVGFVGPVELHNIKILVDSDVSTGGYITGANKKNYHLKNVTLGRDYTSDYIGDFVFASACSCPLCQGKVETEATKDIVSIQKLGLIEYPRSFKYKNELGKTNDIYGVTFEIDVLRILYLIADNNMDEKGIMWPREIAPYEALITVMNVKEDEHMNLANKIYEELYPYADILVDDRNERAGAKFFDSELWGIPVRITIGKKAVDDIVEVKYRDEDKKTEMSYKDAIELVKKYYEK